MNKISGHEVAEMVRLESTANFSPRNWDEVDVSALRAQKPRQRLSGRAIAAVVAATAVVVCIPLLPYVVTLVAKFVYE